jgi:hypothetical protein
MSETCVGIVSYSYKRILKYFTHSGGRGDELGHSPVNPNVSGNKGMTFPGFLPAVARPLVLLCTRILFAHKILLLAGSVQWQISSHLYKYLENGDKFLSCTPLQLGLSANQIQNESVITSWCVSPWRTFLGTYTHTHKHKHKYAIICYNHN